MQIKKYKRVLFVIVCLPIISFAQQNTISPYSAYGIGEVQNQGFALNNSLGGLGVALRSTNFLNPMNPASLSALSQTAFDAGISGSALFLSDANLSQEYFSSTMSYLSLGFPIKEGFGISGGLLPYTFQGYELKQNFKFSDETDSLDYSINHSGSGGLNRVYANIGVELLEGLSVGATGSMIFGTLNQQRDLIFEDEFVLNRRDHNSYYVRDYTYDVGLQFRKNIVDKYFTLGLTYCPQFNLNASNKGAIYTYDIESDFEYIRDTVQVIGTFTNGLILPKSFAAGIALGKTDNWFVSAEYDFKEWSQMRLFGETDENIRNASQYKVGLWWTPNLQDVYNYWSTVQYRVGFNYNTGFLSVSAFDNQESKTDINDLSLSFGLGLPMKRSKTTTNIGVQLGKRGTIDSGLVEEKYIKFHVAFTFNDKWFTKRKID